MLKAWRLYGVYFVTVLCLPAVLTNRALIAEDDLFALLAIGVAIITLRTLLLKYSVRSSGKLQTLLNFSGVSLHCAVDSLRPEIEDMPEFRIAGDLKVFALLLPPAVLVLFFTGVPVDSLLPLSAALTAAFVGFAAMIRYLC